MFSSAGDPRHGRLLRNPLTKGERRRNDSGRRAFRGLFQLIPEAEETTPGRFAATVASRRALLLKGEYFHRAWRRNAA
jgi:hypothetical protein